jgi:hypothetical protein
MFVHHFPYDRIVVRCAAMWIRRGCALTLIVVGGIWFFQGIGVIEGSFMTGEALWAVIGVVCVGAGIALLTIRPTRV